MTEPNSTARNVDVVAMTSELPSEISGFCDEIAYCVAAYSSAPSQTLR
jgi:hypothetical protein